MSTVENPVAVDTDGFETLPSKPLTEEQKDEIFRLYSFKCPVCRMTGGPTFRTARGWHLSVTFQGLKLPSDHLPECLERAQTAHFYIHGLMDDHQMGKYAHTANPNACSHPKCLAERLWGKR